jgi:hypothetical protein
MLAVTKNIVTVRVLTFFFSHVDSLLLIYFTLARYKLECAVPVWCNTTATDTNKLEHVQRRFAVYASLASPPPPPPHT